MKKKHMLKYFSSIIFIVLTVANSFSQEKPNDTIKKTERYGLRFGADISKIARSIYDKNYKGIELVGDYRISKKTYLAAEIGNENKTTQDTRLDFTTKGSYIKAGFDTNFYKNWLNMENMIHLGLRYGASTFSQQLNSYQIYDVNGYFPKSAAVEPGTKFDGLNAHWAEVVAGLKAKLFNNVYAGFSFRINYLIAEQKPENFDNLYIPGFNRTYNGSFGAGWNYTITYFIPLYKKKK